MGERDEILPEYDFSKGVRGKHARTLQQGYNTFIRSSDGTVTVVFRMPGQRVGDTQQSQPSEGMSTTIESSVTILQYADNTQLDAGTDAPEATKTFMDMPVVVGVSSALPLDRSEAGVQTEYSGYSSSTLFRESLPVVNQA